MNMIEKSGGFIPRDISSALADRLSKFPVVTITGPRQSGKSTLLKEKLQNYNYVSLEDPDMRLYAEDDPRGFLRAFEAPLVIDEAQKVPELFSYIQGIVDKEDKLGMYVLSGSQNFLLMEKITQSLAGRIGILRLLPLSLAELQSAGIAPKNLDSWLFAGGYPLIYRGNDDPESYYNAYVDTYLERDVRNVKNIVDLSTFMRFVKLCAGRTGQLLNLNSLGNEAGIDSRTVRSWLSVLEASYIIHLLSPYHKNFNKRLVKSPKLYFYDTGLAASLLGIENPDQLNTHYLRGELFENMVVSEYYKSTFNKGKKGDAAFWRDNNGKEVDLLLGQDAGMCAFEVKSTATYSPGLFANLSSFGEFADVPAPQRALIYGGDKALPTSYGTVIPWRDVSDAFAA